MLKVLSIFIGEIQMTTYDDLVSFHGYKNKRVYDLGEHERTEIIAAFLYTQYKHKNKYNSCNGIIDFLSLSSQKIADFLCGTYKSEEDRLKSYEEFKKHLVSALSDVFDDDIDEDIDQSYHDCRSKENHEDNEADIKLDNIKANRCSIVDIFRKAYQIYDIKCKRYKQNKQSKLNELNELCRKT